MSQNSYTNGLLHKILRLKQEIGKLHDQLRKKQEIINQLLLQAKRDRSIIADLRMQIASLQEQAAFNVAVA